MRASRVLGVVALFVLVFAAISIPLGFLVDGLIVATVGSVSRATSLILQLAVYCLSFVVALLAALRVARSPAVKPGQSTSESHQSPDIGPPLHDPATVEPVAVASSARSIGEGDDAGASVGGSASEPVVRAASGDADAMARQELPSPRRRLPRASTPTLVVAGVLLVAVGAVGALAISALVEPSPSSDAESLVNYFDRLTLPMARHEQAVVWRSDDWTYSGELFGPYVVLKYQSRAYADGPSKRKTYRQLASNLEVVAMDLAAIEAPQSLGSTHARLIDAVTLEIRRWEGFDAVIAKVGTAYEPAAYSSWAMVTERDFDAQKRYLRDWTSSVRGEAREADIKLPPELSRYVQRIEAITEP